MKDLKIIIKIGFVALSLCVFLTGCLTHNSPSKEWLDAETSTAHEEWLYTNKMTWPDIAGPVETVMNPGMRIMASNSENKITITAGEGYFRSYTWDGATRSATLWPRNKRWYGSLGIYFPGPGQHWTSNHGITRGVLQEGVLWFSTTNDVVAWIRGNFSRGNCVYSDNGLLVAWEKIPARKQISVDVWQIMVSGKKTVRLAGSCNNNIVVEKSN